MLNILKLNIIENKLNKDKDIKRNIIRKDYPSSVREWKNSIYMFDKKILKLIPLSTNLTTNLIKSFFNLYNLKTERKMRKNRLLLRLRRLSSNRIYVSNGEFKHTNDKVIINMYVYNRQVFNYKLKSKKIFSHLYGLTLNYKKQLENRFKLIKNIGLYNIEQFKTDRYLISKLLRKSSDVTLVKYNTNIFNRIYYNKFLSRFYKIVSKKYLKKLKLYIYYKQLIYINESKYKFNFLDILKNYIQKIYQKDVEFNIIDLKYFYLHSDLFSQTLTLKITKNRKRLVKYISRLIRKVKIKKYSVIRERSDYYTFQSEKAMSGFDRRRYILKNLKYKYVSGARIQASGRLTKRFTASRSIKKLKYQGNLLNIYSSFKNLSTVLLKGNLRSNLQYTKLNSKTRIGSFGIKGWISSN